MTLGEELVALTRQGVRLWVDDGRLRIQAPQGVLTPERREVLAAHRDEIVALLQHAPRPDAASVDAEQGIVSGPVPLTPRQHQFFRTKVRRDGDNITFFETRGAFDPSLAQRAVEYLLVHHDGLRTRFARGEEGWHAHIAESEQHEVFSFADVSRLAESDRPERVQAAVLRARARIDFEQGPVLQVVFIRFDREGESRLVFLIHHLVIDPRSMAILVEDFELAHGQLQRGDTIRLPPKTSSIKTWAERLVDYAQTAEARDELRYWLSAVSGRVALLPIDHPETLGAKGRMRRIFVGIDLEETRALFYAAPQALGVQSDRVLLAALARAFGEWSGAPGVLLELAGHGREQLFDDIDVSRTVGWFTTQFPVFLDVGQGLAPHAAVRAVEDTLRRIPNAGIGYGILRYLSREPGVAEALERLPAVHAAFNYAGRQEASNLTVPPFLLEAHLKRQAAGVPGRGHSRLKVVASAHGDRLFLRFGFHDGVYEQASIERLGKLTRESVRAMLP
ncbi:MAG TPA: condensation domain-containing protein [Chloroflexota bacterium]